MLDAAKKAEAVLTGQMEGAPSGAATPGEEGDEDEDADADADAADANANEGAPASPAPSTATTTLPDGTKLNAQTFLVRPQRPESAGNNRNRGKFKRRPRPPGTTSAPAPSASEQPEEEKPKPTVPVEEWERDADALALVPEAEHLQLCLEEAWFLSAIGVLKLVDVSGALIPDSAVLTRLLTPSPSPGVGESMEGQALYPADPFLVNYAAYHHFRSLGWCVRPGIKFAVDWLLYRRGPVFSHSAFSVLLVPVFMDEGDRAGPHGDTDWYAEKTSWKWINTVMRVNSLVQKVRRTCVCALTQTVILAYVTVPALSSFPDSARRGGGLDPRKFDMRSLMGRYTVREVSLTRFSAARRRD